MSTIRAGVLLSLNNRLSGGLRRASGDVSSFAVKAGSAFGRVNRAIGGVTGRLATLGGGLSLAVAAKGVIDMEARLVRLGTQASVGADKVAQLRDRVYEVAQDNQIKVDPSQLLDAADAIIERTGDFQFVQENLRNIGLAIQAAGASGVDIGGLFAEFQKGGLTTEEAAAALEILTLQGKMGAFTLENLAALGPRVMNAYAASGRIGVEAHKEMGAALQVIRQGTGSAEQAATAFEALMRNLTDPAKIKKLKAMGVDVRDIVSGEFRSIVDIMRDVVIKGGDLEALGAVFDAEAMRAFTASIAEFKRTGVVESLGEFMELNAEGSTILDDSARNAATMAANLTNVRTAFRKFAEDNLSEPIQKVADALNAATPEDFDRWASGAKKLALGLLAVKGIAVVGSAMSAVSGVMAARRGGKGRGVLGSMGAGMGGAMPVYVTNWGGAGSVLGGRGSTAGGAVMRHTGARGGTLAALKASARSGGVRGIVARTMFAPAVKVSAAAARSGALGGTLRALGKVTNVAGKAAPWLAVAGGALSLATTAMDKSMSKQEKTLSIGKSGGGTAGALIGGALGAFGGPLGVALGSAAGAWAGNWIGGKIGEGLNKARDIRAGSVTGQMSPYLAGYASRSLQLEQVKTDAPPPEVNLTTNVSIEESADGFNIETEVYRGGERIAAETGYQARSFVP